jgi:hypothetical protein
MSGIHFANNGTQVTGWDPSAPSHEPSLATGGLKSAGRDKPYYFRVVIRGEDYAYDISFMSPKLSINENLYSPFVTATLEILDAQGLLEAVMNTANNLIDITVHYYGFDLQRTLVVDGIENINMDNASSSSKTYIINLKSLYARYNAFQTVSSAFDGRADEVISNLMERIVPPELQQYSLNVRTEAETKGKYIAPNISPMEAIGKILENTYDRAGSPMFIFEKAFDTNGITMELNSFDNMMAEGVSIYDASPIVESGADERNMISVAWGKPEKVIVRADNNNEILKIEQGLNGKTVQLLNLGNTTHKSEVWDYKLIYDNTNRDKRSIMVNTFVKEEAANSSRVSIPYFGFDDDGQLINNANYIHVCRAESMKAKMNDTTIDVYSCKAFPNLSAGRLIEFNLADATPLSGHPSEKYSNKSHKYSGDFLIQAITHRITGDDYYQDLTLIRDGGQE